MKRHNLKEIVHVGSRFSRSVLLSNEQSRLDALEGYVVSPLARDSLMRVLSLFTPDAANRAIAIVGPYGSGKSSFAAFVSNLMQDRESTAHAIAKDRFREQWQDRGDDLERQLDRIGGSFVSALVTGSRAPLGALILRGLSDAATQHWDGRTGRAPSVVSQLQDAVAKIDAGDPISDEGVLHYIKALLAQLHKGSTSAVGLNLVIDEFGKILEWATLQPGTSDIFLLQQIAELASSQSRGRLAITVISHQAFEAYASGLPRETRLEWAKIEGRFETMPYLESPAHLTRLVAQAIRCDVSTDQLSNGAAVRRYAAKFAELKDEDEEAVERYLECFPLNPVTASVLGQVFRLRMGQNERSMFAFLASAEPFGFDAYLRRDQAGSRRGYCLDDLYDYLTANTGVRFSVDRSERAWAAAELALHRLKSNAMDVDVALIKAITILSLVERFAGPRADAEMLSVALEIDLPTIEYALDGLSKNSVIIYRAYKSGYQLWDGSDLDVGAILTQMRNGLAERAGLAARLQKQFPLSAVAATRHGYKTGTLRYLAASYVEANDVPVTAPMPTTGDGFLFYVIPAGPDSLRSARDRVDAAAIASDGRPQVYAFPRDPDEVTRCALDLFAIEDVGRETKELDGDPVARRELSEREVAATVALDSALERSYGSFLGREQLDWTSPGFSPLLTHRPSSAASTLFDSTYQLAPVIKNELVNRQALSTQGARAQRMLMERMLSSAHLPRLGIEKTPPELSMYRSVLEATGLHLVSERGSAEFVHPKEVDTDASSGLRAAWQVIDAALDAAPESRTTVATLLASLAAPPLGIRRGVAPVLLLAYYLTEKSQTFVYEDNSFVHELQADIVNRILRKPGTIEFQRVAENSRLGPLLALLTEVLFGKTDTVPLLKIVRMLLHLSQKLSSFAQTTQELSKDAIRVRSAISSARDPVRLLTEALPTAVNVSLDETSADAAERRVAYAKRLHAATMELRRADAGLQRRIEETLRALLREKGDDDAFYHRMAARAGAMAHAQQPVRMTAAVRRFITVTAALNPHDPEARADWLQAVGVAVMGRPPELWADADVALFGIKAQSVCDQFRASESLSLRFGGRSVKSMSAFRVSVLDEEGRERSGVSVLTADERERVVRFTAKLRDLAAAEGIEGEQLTFGVIASMLAASKPDGTMAQEEEHSVSEGTTDLDGMITAPEAHA